MSDEVQPLFNENSQAVAMRNDAAAVARATQEIQAALVIAKRPEYARDEVRSLSNILKACQRKGLAEMAEYEYSRGGTRITGPTIDLLLAIANRWGNVLYGWDEVERKDGQSRVRAWAWDLQNNSRTERTFYVRHWRDTQAGGYELTDERDIYELIANMASRRVRSCLEQVIDQDVQDAAVDACRDTLRKGETSPLRERAAKMVLAFAEFGVTQARVETRLGNKLEAVSENQLASLRRVYKSLKDGVGKVEDYFKPEMSKPEFTNGAKETPPQPKPVSQTETEPSFDNAAPSEKPSITIALESATKQSGLEKDTKVQLLRSACKSQKIPESVLLGFLSEIGLADGSAPTIADLPNSVLDKVVAQWKDMSKRIQDAQAGLKEELL